MNDTASSAQRENKVASRYALIVQWSEEDNCYVGSAPDLIYGGCHGDDPRQVFDELCQIVEDVVADKLKHGEDLPEPRNALEQWRQSSEQPA